MRKSGHRGEPDPEISNVCDHHTNYDTMQCESESERDRETMSHEPMRTDRACKIYTSEIYIVAGMASVTVAIWKRESVWSRISLSQLIPETPGCSLPSICALNCSSVFDDFNILECYLKRSSQQRAATPCGLFLCFLIGTVIFGYWLSVVAMQRVVGTCEYEWEYELRLGV